MTKYDGTYKIGVMKDGSLGLRTQLFRDKGYWVSDDTGVTVHGGVDDNGIANALSLMDIQQDEIVGVWTDDKSGICYIDRSYHFARKTTAWKVAELFDQIAIWDCAAGRSLDIRYA